MRDMSAAKILLALREGKAFDWETLCHAFGMLPHETHTGTYILAAFLEDLQQAGLISLEDTIDPRLFHFPKGRIELASNWSRIQNVLDLSLKDLARVRPKRAMFIEPFFGSSEKSLDTDKLDLFMLMPFSLEFKPIYDDHIKIVAQTLGLTIKRGDDFFTTHQVMKDVWQSICAARMIIADCTGRNPNVFYEIGMAHTVGKPVILITQENEDVPFDLRHIRYIQYQYTPPGMKQFEQSLASTIKQLVNSGL